MRAAASPHAAEMRQSASAPFAQRSRARAACGCAFCTQPSVLLSRASAVAAGSCITSSAPPAGVAAGPMHLRHRACAAHLPRFAHPALRPAGARGAPPCSRLLRLGCCGCALLRIPPAWPARHSHLQSSAMGAQQQQPPHVRNGRNGRNGRAAASAPTDGRAAALMASFLPAASMSGGGIVGRPASLRRTASTLHRLLLLRAARSAQRAARNARDAQRIARSAQCVASRIATPRGAAQ